MRKQKFKLFPFIFIGIAFLLTQVGCSYFQEKADPEVVAQVVKEKPVTFSENPNIGVFNPKMYKRSTRKSIEDESEVHAKAGSFWNAEGQSGFLFTQNTSRQEGDGLNIKLEGAPKDQILTKVDVIKKLLARLDAPPPPPAPEEGADRNLASVDANAQATPGATNKPTAKVAPKVAAPVVAATPKTEEEEPFKVDMIPSKITERLADGNYRIKGAQTFMIGKREYKVIVTGLIRSDDFNDEGVSASRVLDPQFDVVSVRRNLQ